jgi:hypothetical protein
MLGSDFQRACGLKSMNVQPLNQRSWTHILKGHPSLKDFHLIPQFIQPLEEDLLIKACLWKLKRSCGPNYLTSHFDGVMKGSYRECTAQHWGPYEPSVNEILDRCRDSIMKQCDRRIDFMIPHILELKDENSHIHHHVDHLEVN